MFLGKHVRLFGKVAHVFKKTRTCFSMEDKEGSKDKRIFTITLCYHIMCGRS